MERGYRFFARFCRMISCVCMQFYEDCVSLSKMLFKQKCSANSIDENNVLRLIQYLA